jgi:hypothetical protein
MRSSPTELITEYKMIQISPNLALSMWALLVAFICLAQGAGCACTQHAVEKSSGVADGDRLETAPAAHDVATEEPKFDAAALCADRKDRPRLKFAWAQKTEEHNLPVDVPHDPEGRHFGKVRRGDEYYKALEHSLGRDWRRSSGSDLDACWVFDKSSSQIGFIQHETGLELVVAAGVITLAAWAINKFWPTHEARTKNGEQAVLFLRCPGLGGSMRIATKGRSAKDIEADLEARLEVCSSSDESAVGAQAGR